MGLTACIITLATNDQRFAEGLVRLEDSVRRSGFRGTFLSLPPGSFPPGCPSHQDVPFAFKPHCFREASARGMDLVLWLDSACVVLRSLDPLFRAMARDGYVLFRNQAYVVGEWASDQAIHALELSREESMSISEVNAAAIGLNLRHPAAAAFLDQWYRAAQGEVAFRGSREPLRTAEDYQAMKWNRSGRASADPRVRGHRHDQTVAGVLAHRLQMKLTPHGLLPYSTSHRGIRPGTIIAIDRSVGRLDVPLLSAEQIRRGRYLGPFRQYAAAIRSHFG